MSRDATPGLRPVWWARPAVGTIVRRVTSVVLVGLVVVVSASGPAAAHTDLLQGSPGPGQLAGGTVDFVDLVFVAPVTNARVEVRGPDGETVAGEVVVADGQIIRYRMEALTREGSYAVAYQVISADGDDTGGGYGFTYEADALQPIPFGPDDAAVPDDSRSTATWFAVAAGAVAIVAVCLLTLVRLERRRAEPEETGGPS